MMAYLWMMTAGFVICLGLLCGTLLYFISSSLVKDDSKRIDLLDTDKKQESKK